MINLEAINTTYYRKDMENMSFVGIHNTKSGLIAFAGESKDIEEVFLPIRCL